jgi:TM2 domain-containing membrane protein YozV/Tfp pilus assembly protein PilE
LHPQAGRHPGAGVCSRHDFKYKFPQFFAGESRNQPYQKQEIEMSEMVFCRACGKEVHKTAVACPACGAQLILKRYKDKTAAALLAFFLGGLGIHRFYLGQWWGIFYLLFCWTLIPGLIAFIEFIVFLASDKQKWDDKYNDGLSSGSSSNTAMWIIVAAVIAIVGIAVIGILAAIAIPAYQEYTVRAQTAQAYALAQEAATAVGEHYAAQKQIPANLKAAGFNATLPSTTESIEVNPQNGVLTVRFASNALKGKSLILTPQENAQGEIMWSCSSEDIRAQLLPQACRQ